MRDPSKSDEMSTKTMQPDAQVEEHQTTARLSVLAPRELRGTIPLDDATVTLGRGSDHGISQIKHDTISRRHLKIVEVSPQSRSLTDLGSRNGTWVNGETASALPTLLEDGDVVRFGEAVAVYEMGEVGDVQPGGEADRIPGFSLPVTRTRHAVLRAALSGGSTLIEGESGTGKEFVASELHRIASGRGPYVVANCAALAASLIDSQLFGHERGAFTGAVSAHEGFFRAADGGTLFLDEIGELPLELQPKLLRAVELGEVVPLGGTRVHQVDVRVVAATNRDLEAEVGAARFRRDLFARLAMQRIEVPPLRARRADFIVWYELLHERWSRAQSSLDVAPPEFTAEAIEALLLEPWPENLRGLDRVVHGVGGLLLTRGHNKVTVGDVRPWLRGLDETPPGRDGLPSSNRTNERKPPKPTREEFIEAMEAQAWSVRGTARHFRRDRRQIYRWIRLFGVIRPDDAPDD